jgi:hypothetical protein
VHLPITDVQFPAIVKFCLKKLIPVIKFDILQFKQVLAEALLGSNAEDSDVDQEVNLPQ